MRTITMVDNGYIDSDNDDAEPISLCVQCGLFANCACTLVDNPNELLVSTYGEHSYSEDYRSTARQHKRTGRVLTRKRSSNPSQWKQSKRKKLRQSGQQYTNVSGHVQRPKGVRVCQRDHMVCRFKCAIAFNDDERTDIHNEHWNLGDEYKRHFYINTTSVAEKSCSRRAANVNAKKMSYCYFFKKNNKNVRVCKDFYLATLDVDAKRIRSSHRAVNDNTGLPAPYRRGGHNRNRMPREFIRKHIESVPKVDSHYCRSRTNKEYISGCLNLQILYEKYKELCAEEGVEPQKLHTYRRVFNSEYNIEFQKPKKDRCDTCEAARVRRINGSVVTNEEKVKIEDHVKGKQETHEERTADRQNKTVCVVCFDLQNVFSLPTANVSNFFYKRKLNCYHLTGHCSTNKQSYGVLWPETLSGRAANDIASGLVVILDRVLLDNPNVKDIILWSDSCVPQNRNKIMTVAIQLFIQDHTSVNTITHKYCQPGHSEVQEVDNLHSVLEKVTSVNEIYSPLGLMRILCRSPRSKPMNVVQLRKSDMKDYHSTANLFKFDGIPFSRLKALHYSHETPMRVQYKTKFSDTTWEMYDIVSLYSLRSSGNQNSRMLQQLTMPSQVTKTQVLSQEKVKDIRSMLQYMPEVDRIYIETLLQPTVKVSQFTKDRSGTTTAGTHSDDTEIETVLRSSQAVDKTSPKTSKSNKKRRTGDTAGTRSDDKEIQPVVGSSQAVYKTSSKACKSYKNR